MSFYGGCCCGFAIVRSFGALMCCLFYVLVVYCLCLLIVMLDVGCGFLRGVDFWVR